MNIGFLVPELVNCGPVNVVLNMVKSFEKMGYKTKLICIREMEKNTILEDFQNSCSLGVFSLENNIKNIEKNILELNVLHSHGFFPDKILFGLKNNGIKKITTIHCMFYRDYIKEYGFIKGFLGSLLHFYYLKKGNFNYIVGCSDAVKDYVLKKINTSNIVAINNGVDQSIFRRISHNEKIIRKIDLNISNYKKIFVYAGRLIRRKRVPELIEIFKKKYSQDDLLIILGDGDEMLECKMRGSQKNIMFLGVVGNPEYFYQIADYVISNSSAEGYPMSILEAVSCGCIAILSDIEPHLEFIKNNPDYSFLIENRIDFEKKYINDTSCLSSEVMTSKYLKLYKA